MVILGAALVVSLALRKSSAAGSARSGPSPRRVWRGGRRLFGRTFALPRWADVPLRSLKYLLLAFFLRTILVQMPAPAIRAFLANDYWKISDLKMLHFFTGMSATAAAVLAVLVALSLVTKAFWCRYLCPYGALTGLLAAPDRCGSAATAPCASPAGTARGIARRCSRRPQGEHRFPRVRRLPDLREPLPRARRAGRRAPAPDRDPPLLFAAAVVAVFFGILLAARLAGHWHSGVSGAEYLRLAPSLLGLAHP